MAKLRDVLLADELAELLRFASRISGLDVNKILGKNRHQEPVYYRHILWYFMANDLEMTHAQIESSWPVEYDRSSITHGINSIRESHDDPARVDGIVRVLGRFRSSMREVPFETGGVRRVWWERHE